MKWIGMMLVLFSSGGIGLWSAWCFRGRLRTLERLRQLIYCLKGEITYSHAPLKEAMERVGRRETGSLGMLFLTAAEGIDSGLGESFGEIWEAAVERLAKQEEGRLLLAQDLEQLKGLGGHLGYLDVEMQSRALLLYLEELELSVQYLRSHQRERCRLYTSLGFLGGLFLVIAIY